MPIVADAPRMSRLPLHPRPDADTIAELQLKVAELTHRMKNLLTMVQAVAYQTLQPDRTVAEAQEALNGRIAALGRALDLFQRTFDEADIADIVRTSLTSDGARWRMSGPPCAVAGTVAMSLVLIFQELECNAIKHGALSTVGGSVAVEWEVVDSPAGPVLDLQWIERGGPPVRQPNREGTGSRLLARILRRLDATFAKRFVASGFEWRMAIPVASLSG